MKYHISIKFIAFFLATLSLFTLVASAGGIIGLTASNLYEQSVDQLYADTMQNTRQNLAVHLVHQYASLNLGKLPDSYFYDHWGSSWMNETFQYGSYFYDIYDENGNLVASTTQDMPSGALIYTHVVTDMSYRHLIEILPEDDEVFPGVSEVTFPAATPSEPPASTTSPEPTYDLGATEATDADAPSETTQSQDPTEAPKSADSTVDTTFPEITSTTGSIRIIQDADILRDNYFDPESEQWTDFTFFIDKLPPYTVTLYLMPGAVVVEPVWDLLTIIWQLRYVLFYVLAGSILLFAICAVYLCCAAGRKPGSNEIKAEGLNRIPLDLYGLGGGFGIFALFWIGIEVSEYLVRNSPDVLVPFVIAAGTGACLIVVGFFFACAAQFKTPGGYWWRNTLIGHVLRVLKRLCGMFFSLCWKAFPWCGKNLIRFLRFLIRLLKLLWDKFRMLVAALFHFIGKFFRWVWQKISRIFDLLPLTWQWLLVGFAMLLVAAVSFAARHPVALLIGIGLSLGIVLYGANSFGILMESAKKMGKGDLDTKVSDQFLMGSFKEFAGDLNALADVAVVAAQKQLKSERMKTELITNVSHDIKTPLTSIINYVDLLEKPHTEQEGAEYLEVLHRQSQRLKKLVDDLMEMSKASTGNLAVDITSVDAGEAINQALGEFADKLERAKLTPLFRLPDEPVYMKADGRLVWRVMSNLLSNAVKYALPGTRVYIDLAEQEGKVVISMKNISREELNVSADELLERFVRGDTSRNTEGSGLGLNIAQSLMELQKGQLQLLVDGDLFKVTLTFPAVQM